MYLYEPHILSWFLDPIVDDKSRFPIQHIGSLFDPDPKTNLILYKMEQEPDTPLGAPQTQPGCMMHP